MISVSFPFLLIAIPLIWILGWLIARSRGRPIPLLRLTALTLLILACAGLGVRLGHPQIDLILLVDRSASVERTERDIDIYARMEKLVAENPGFRAAVVGFARDSRILSGFARPIAGSLSLPLPADATNIVAGVALSLSLLPDDEPGEIVLMSDGHFSDDVDIAIGEAQLAGVPISVLPIGDDLPTDVSLVDFSGPGEVGIGRPFSLRLAIDAPQTSSVTIALYRGDRLVASRDMTVPPGRTTASFTDRLLQLGAYPYRAIVKGEDDPIPENDSLSLLVHTTDRPEVLLLTRDERSSLPVLLDAVGLTYTRTANLPSLAGLAPYRQLILTGFPLDSLTGGESRRIERFVKDLGGGLLVIQGEEEVRGFAETKIDPLLPVSSLVPEEAERPSLAVVYLLDRSSSMSALTHQVAKIRILRDAAAASITLLPPDALAGVVAFNEAFRWLIPLSPVGDGTGIYGALRNLRADGGTDIYYPIVAALDRLETADARSKYIILISDGRTTSEERDYPGLFSRLAGSGVALSAIALGEYPNLELLRGLTDAGHGTLYHVVDFMKLPQLTMQVTERLSRSRFVIGEVEVSGPLIGSAGLGALPPLDGYVRTYPRAGARVLLSAGDDPLFSTWHVGLGSVSVLNTDLAGRWSDKWLDSPDMSRLFELMLKETEPLTMASAGLVGSVSIGDPTSSLVVDARDETGRFADFLDLQAKLVPEGDAFPVPQVAPGLYRGEFPTPVEGGHAIRLADRTTGRSGIFPFTVPYPPEYRKIGIDRERLKRVAAMTGGRLLLEDEALPSLEGGETRRLIPLFPYLLAAALAIYLIELVVRRWPGVRRRD